jgi:hypothetical protein
MIWVTQSARDLAAGGVPRGAVLSWWAVRALVPVLLIAGAVRMDARAGGEPELPAWRRVAATVGVIVFVGLSVAGVIFGGPGGAAGRAFVGGACAAMAMASLFAAGGPRGWSVAAIWLSIAIWLWA